MPNILMPVILAGLFVAPFAGAREAVFDTKNKQWLTVEQVAETLPPQSIVVFGEEHMIPDNENDPVMVRHHENQARWLETLKAVSLNRDQAVTLGLEFLAYPDQKHVDDYLAGRLPQSDFLRLVNWGSNPFAPFDRLMQIVKSPSYSGAFALNAPKGLSSRVAKVGKDGLNPEEQALLPPIWERGGQSYFERFAATMRGHVPEEKIERYFWAQSLWDDTMAWNATKNLKGSDIMTIIVGEFHVEFGHGLPARLKRYGAESVRTLLQHYVPANEPWPETITPDPVYGDAADYIYVYSL